MRETAREKCIERNFKGPCTLINVNIEHSLSHVQVETSSVSSEGHLTLGVHLVHEEFGAVSDNLTLSQTLPGISTCVVSTHHVQVVSIFAGLPDTLC